MNPLVVISCMFATAFAAPSNYNLAPAPAPVALAQPLAYTTTRVAGAPITTIEQPPPIVTKQIHYGKTQFVSGYAANILKPPIPDFNIQVPTVLKGSVTQHAPIVKTVKEPYVVNEYVPVPKPVYVPVDVPVVKEITQEVPVPVYVDEPYLVPKPVLKTPVYAKALPAPVAHHY